MEENKCYLGKCRLISVCIWVTKKGLGWKAGLKNYSN